MANGRMEHEVRKVDPSGRLSLGRERAGEQYDIVEGKDGVMILTPVVVVPRRELWLHRNPEAMRMVERGLAQSADGETSSLGSFAGFLDDEDED